MEELSFSLRVKTNISNYDEVSRVLNVYPEDYSFGWIYPISNKRNLKFSSIINKLLDVLEGHYKELEEFGISNDKISIWVINRYKEQCNMEFSPKEMKRLGVNGIILCVSCYESG